jgi:radical SAM protein with 4Fe4S-binding SPASM domain
LSCKYCFNYRALQSPSIDLDLDLIEKALQSKLAKSVKDWFLSGGEPVLYRHLPVALKLFREHGIGPKIATNGTQLTPEIMESWVGCGVRSVQFSLDTLKPDRHADLHGGGRQDHEAILRNLQHAVRSPLRVVVSSVLTEANKREIQEIMAFCFESGVDSYTLYPNVPSDAQNKELIVPFPELLELTDDLFSAYSSLCPTKIIDMTIPRFSDSSTYARWKDILAIRLHYCAAAQFALKITSAGRVSACICQDSEPFIIGDLRRQSLDDIWVSEKAMEFRSLYKKIPECSLCSQNSVCRGGCRNNASLFGTKGIYSLDPYCQFFKSRIE